MATAKNPPPERPAHRTSEQDGRLIVEPPVYEYRVLFSSGKVLDVLAVQDGSVLRELLLRLAGEERIEGVTPGVHHGWATIRSDEARNAESQSPGQPTDAIPPVEGRGRSTTSRPRTPAGKAPPRTR